MQRFCCGTLACTLILITSLSAQNVQHGLRVPDGFEITEVADHTLANDIYTLTLDPKGRLTVAGRGYIRILVDENNDGKADRAIQFADSPKDGAMGMLWEGDTLYVTGDGGLRRFRDQNGDDKADGPSELIRRLKTGGEHSAHAIRRGPDGWLYVLCGNYTGIDDKYTQTPTSPIKKPIAGVVLRFTPDLKKSEIVADGFRNAYDMDFNKEGELFTYDSDNERCVSLPWYEPTRFYHVISGGHYGWRNPQYTSTWRFPPYFIDVVPPVEYCERGSPTGVACYRHHQFPEKYRNGFFLCDWTFGIIYFVQPKEKGASYTGKREVFLKAVGDNGFAPTDIVVHPKTGDLYVSIGGRGTRGAVYRIRYSKGLDEAKKKGVIPVQKRSLEWSPELKKQLLQMAESKNAQEQLRAFVLIQRHRARFTTQELLPVLKLKGGLEPKPTDRHVLRVKVEMAATLEEKEFQSLREKSTSDRSVVSPISLAWSLRKRGTLTTKEILQIAGNRVFVLGSNRNPERSMRLIRLIQMHLGGAPNQKLKGTVFEGYSARKRVSPAEAQLLLSALQTCLHSGNSELKDELEKEFGRTLAMLEDDSTAMLERLMKRHLKDHSHPSDDVHYLIVTARLRAKRSKSITSQIADTMIRLDEKIVARKMNRDRHWPTRLKELHRELVKKDPNLNKAIVEHRDFGRPDHVVWTDAPGFDKKKAAERFLERAKKDNDFAWDAQLIRLIAQHQSEKALPVLRELWGNAGQDRALLSILAKNPQPVDREKFLEAVSQPAMHDAGLALKTLKKLPPNKDADTMLALVQGLRRLPSDKAQDKLRSELVNYLQQLTNNKAIVNKDGWSQWLIKEHPKLAAGISDGVNWETWKKRLADLNWERGDVMRGKQIYVKTSCIACHSGSRALGPDLRGITGRFSREDLFAAMVRPSKDVSSRYRTLQLRTRRGKTYQGVIVYEAVDSVIVQTGPAQTVRLKYSDIEQRQILTTSLMPVGLLDRLKDEEIVDLYAYLKSLK